jgi:hypothetical protein
MIYDNKKHAVLLHSNLKNLVHKNLRAYLPTSTTAALAVVQTVAQDIADRFVDEKCIFKEKNVHSNQLLFL